jgi:hypothetical protein
LTVAQIVNHAQIVNLAGGLSNGSRAVMAVWVLVLRPTYIPRCYPCPLRLNIS